MPEEVETLYHANLKNLTTPTPEHRGARRPRTTKIQLPHPKSRPKVSPSKTLHTFDGSRGIPRLGGSDLTQTCHQSLPIPRTLPRVRI